MKNKIVMYEEQFLEFRNNIMSEVKQTLDNYKSAINNNADKSENIVNYIKNLEKYQDEYNMAMRIIYFTRDYNWKSEKLRDYTFNRDINELSYIQITSLGCMSNSFDKIDKKKSDDGLTVSINRYDYDGCVSDMTVKSYYAPSKVEFSDDLKDAIKDAMGVKEEKPKVKFEDTILGVIKYPWKYNKKQLYNVAMFIKESLEKDYIIKKY